MRSVALLLTLLVASGATLLATMLLLRRITDRVPVLIVPAFIISAMLAVMLSTVSVAVTGLGVQATVLAVLGMSILILAIWIPQVYQLAKHGPQVRVLPETSSVATHRPGYYVAGAASLLALGVAAYLGIELWMDSPTRHEWAAFSAGVLAYLAIMGGTTAWAIRRYRLRATGLLVTYALGAGLVPVRWGILPATLFLLGAILNHTAFRGVRRPEPSN